MFHRMLTAIVVLLGLTVVLPAGQPGEKAVGPAFKTKGFVLTLGKMKSSSEVDLNDATKNKFTLELAGSLEIAPKLDVVAVVKQLRIQSIADEKGKDVPLKATAAGTPGGTPMHNAITEGVGQVELPRIDAPCDVSRIGTMVLAAEIVLVSERKKAKIPAIVMEDNKDIGYGISVRVTRLSMSKDRELTVEIAYERADNSPGSPFIEKIYAVGADKKDLGGGRWTEGDPFNKTGVWKCKFKLDGEQVHQSFRLEVATKSEARSLTFDVKKIFRPEVGAKE